MSVNNIPHFIIKKNLQKSKQTGIFFSDVITDDILKDVCFRITGQEEFTCDLVDNDYQDNYLTNTYNKGRIAIMHYDNTAYFISFSEKEIGGRNSSVQSVPTAFNIFYSNTNPNKKLCYYFINDKGNPETEYHKLIYRLMKTIGFDFLNEAEALESPIIPFRSIEEIIFYRRINSGKNRSNHSSYIDKNSFKKYEIYGKTYGANKYETSLITYALSILAPKDSKVFLYEILDNSLKELPKSCLDIIKLMGVVTIVPTDVKFEKNVFENNNSLRSPKYIYNLFDKLGEKHCALCECEIPELIQGAHICPVADIKKMNFLTQEQKLQYATDGNNGLWLCENHHKMFDENLIVINKDGSVFIKESIDEKHIIYINSVTTNKKIPDEILTPDFIMYLELRNNAS